LLTMLSATILKGKTKVCLETWFSPCPTGHFTGNNGQITKLFSLKSSYDFWGTWTQILRDNAEA